MHLVVAEPPAGVRRNSTLVGVAVQPALAIAAVSTTQATVFSSPFEKVAGQSMTIAVASPAIP